MMITKFEGNRKNIEKQYERIKAYVDENKSKKLYGELSDIYYSEKSKQIGKGKALRHYFENVQIFINPDDIFADLADTSNAPIGLRGEECERYRKNNKSASVLQSEGAIYADCDFGHTMPDWNNVFSGGIIGIINKADRYLDGTSLTESQREFYVSVKDAYEGILIYTKRLYEKACREQTDNARFAAKNLLSLTERAPETLAEAMQLYFIYYTAQHFAEGENLRSLGALDDILFPYYKHDIDNGICTDEDVRELVKYFLFKWNSMEILANIPFNLCTNTNEFTYIVLEEYTKLNVPDPKIHIKCSDKMPDRVYEIIMNSIRNGNNSFVFVNDKIVKKALMHIGIDKADAENYTIIGCYEPSAAGKEIPCTLNGRINMPMAVETVLNGGRRFGSEELIGIENDGNFPTFESFYDAVKEQLKVWSGIAEQEIIAIENEYPNIIQSPILSATFDSCMETGRDAYNGGAKYNNSSICIFGVATVTDALTAIKKAVFEEKIISLSELTEILKKNWNGAEVLRKRIQEKYPKYGNNNPEADEIAQDLEYFMAECINNKPNGRGGVFRMGIFSIDWIIHYGHMLGASADGRFAGEPVSKNLSASVGMDKKGVTGIINSSTKFDYGLVPNGAVLDLQLHPSAVAGNEGIAVMVNLLKTYLLKGGFATHINVVDSETLKKAQKDPEKYRNLQVRLCGWNVYFTDLDIEMQNDFIKSLEG